MKQARVDNNQSTAHDLDTLDNSYTVVDRKYILYRIASNSGPRGGPGVY